MAKGRGKTTVRDVFPSSFSPETLANHDRIDHIDDRDRFKKKPDGFIS